MISPIPKKVALDASYKKPLQTLAFTALLLAFVANCSTYQYAPQRTAPGELTIHADRIGVKLIADGKIKAQSLDAYAGLEKFVSCVPRARVHARHAFQSHAIGAALSTLAGVLGLTSFILLARSEPYEHTLGTGVVAAISLGGSIALRHRALGHVVDAMNYYNDQVGSLGASCGESPLNYVTPEPLDSDRDGDGLVDRLDKCPTQAGPLEYDGCKPKVIVLSRETISLPQQVRFASGKVDILPAAAELLDEVVTVLKSRSSLRVHIQGHADLTGLNSEDELLSQTRSRVVMQYLIKHGVSQSRLSAAGYGATKPLCKDRDVSCHANNRRVDFVVVQQ